MFKWLADHRETDSLARKMRQQRFALFRELIMPLPRPVQILDIGGSATFWEQMDFMPTADIQITLLNIDSNVIQHPQFEAIVADGTNLSTIPDQTYSVVFSNSVIEHLGTFSAQQAMADEIRRVGKNYFVQTPNYYFPIEPHFLTPFFQFLPVKIQRWLGKNYRLGWYPTREATFAAVQEIRLLKKKELKTLFPEACLHHERFWGLTKSFIAYFIESESS